MRPIVRQREKRAMICVITCDEPEMNNSDSNNRVPLFPNQDRLHKGRKEALACLECHDRPGCALEETMTKIHHVAVRPRPDALRATREASKAVTMIASKGRDWW